MEPSLKCSKCAVVGRFAGGWLEALGDSSAGLLVAIVKTPIWNLNNGVSDLLF